ncbi:hypothetical protein HDV00_004559 [Rhizophlyctis rosea]|nr:hypothetical protein HDV00_004559 [Rhizophlyctis rosea]
MLEDKIFLALVVKNKAGAFVTESVVSVSHTNGRLHMPEALEALKVGSIFKVLENPERTEEVTSKKKKGFSDEVFTPGSMVAVAGSQKIAVSMPFGETTYEHIQETTGCEYDGYLDFKNVELEKEKDAWLKDTPAGRRALSGRPDYLVGHAGGKRLELQTSPPDDTHLLVVEAKVAWDEEDFRQLAAGAAAIHKKRRDKGKANRIVWGVLTNGVLWGFCHVDQDGKLQVTSKPLVADVKGDGKGNVEWKGVVEVYSHLLHVCRKAYTTSPTTTPATLQGRPQQID